MRKNNPFAADQQTLCRTISGEQESFVLLCLTEQSLFTSDIVGSILVADTRVKRVREYSTENVNRVGWG